MQTPVSVTRQRPKQAIRIAAQLVQVKGVFAPLFNAFGIDRNNETEAIANTGNKVLPQLVVEWITES